MKSIIWMFTQCIRPCFRRYKIRHAIHNIPKMDFNEFSAYNRMPEVKKKSVSNDQAKQTIK